MANKTTAFVSPFVLKPEIVSPPEVLHHITAPVIPSVPPIPTHIVPTHVTVPPHIVTTHIVPTHIVPTHIVTTHIVPTHITPTHIVTTHIVPTHIVPTHIVPTHIVPTHIVPTHIAPTHIVTTHIVPTHIVPTYIVPTVPPVPVHIEPTYTVTTTQIVQPSQVPIPTVPSTSPITFILQNIMNPYPITQGETYNEEKTISNTYRDGKEVQIFINDRYITKGSIHFDTLNKNIAKIKFNTFATAENKNKYIRDIKYLVMHKVPGVYYGKIPIFIDADEMEADISMYPLENEDKSVIVINIFKHTYTGRITLPSLQIVIRPVGCSVCEAKK